MTTHNVLNICNACDINEVTDWNPMGYCNDCLKEMTGADCPTCNSFDDPADCPTCLGTRTI